MKTLSLLLLGLALAGKAFSQDEAFRKKFVNHTEVGVLQGQVKASYGYMASEVRNRSSLTMQTYNGIQLTRRFSAGGTIGMDWYKTAIINTFAAGLRMDLFKNKPARFYAGFDGGYGAGWFQKDVDGYKTKGGWMWSPAIGMKYGKPGGNAFTITLGFRQQLVRVDRLPNQWEIVSYEDRKYNRLVVRIGMAF